MFFRMQSVIRLCRLDNSFTDRFVDVITSCVASLVSPQLSDDNGEIIMIVGVRGFGL